MSQKSESQVNDIPDNRIQIRTAQSVYIIEKTAIIRCQADNNYTTIYIQNHKDIVKSRTLKEFEAALPYPGFIRIHQSHLINAGFIRQIDRQNTCVVLHDNSRIPVAIRKRSLIAEYLKQVPSL